MKVIFVTLVSILLILSAVAFLRKGTPPPIVDSTDSVLAIDESLQPSLAGLTDENGQTMPPDHFRGQWNIVFFGYSRCPDVCPVTLGFLSKLAQSLPSGSLKFYFVSLDPDDDAATLKAYTDRFHKDIIGVTGDAAAQQTVAASFQTSFHAGKGLLSHPTQLFVIDPQGRLRYLVKTINNPKELLRFFSQLEGSKHASP